MNSTTTTTTTIDSQTLKTIACAIVGAKLDYCNSILHGIPVGNLNKLQSSKYAGSCRDREEEV